MAKIERDFWDDPSCKDTYDLEITNSDGRERVSMVRRLPGKNSRGHWVHADDYKDEVEFWVRALDRSQAKTVELGARVKELEADIVVWRQQQQARLDRNEY
jgi:hypothetical protein